MERCFHSKLLILALAVPSCAGVAQAQDAVRKPFEYHGTKPPIVWSVTTPSEKPLPINLPTALRLVHGRSMDVALAAERILQAGAQHQLAKYAWLPTITIGPDYYRHDGRFQAVNGEVITTSRTSFMTGAGITATFAPNDAIYGPLAARQVVRARQADLDTAANNITLTTAEAYFNAQQARGDLAGAEDALRHAGELARRAEKLSAGLTLPVEAARARTELARRKQALYTAQERWKIASADLIRVLRLDATALIDPVEAPHMRVGLVCLEHPIDVLIPIGLRNRPELASQQALVEATLNRLTQERIRPLVPSVVLRGGAPGPNTVGLFGGGSDAMRNYGVRSDIDLQVVWEFQNLLFGNRAKIRERESENRLAVLEMFRLQDIVAAEIVQAHAQAKSAEDRMVEAEAGLKDALDSVEKNFQGLSQTRRAGDFIILMVRPQEVIASIQALSQAYYDFYGAIGDFNRAQFRLFRALGYPSHLIAGDCVPPSPRSHVVLRPTSGSVPSRRD